MGHPASLSGSLTSEAQAFFSVRFAKEGHLAEVEKRVSPLRCAPVEMTSCRKRVKE